jgi:hypothetical protein
MKLKAEKVEVRGIEQKVSAKTQKPYLIIRVEETETGESNQIISNDLSVASKLQKGFVVDCRVNVNSYGRIDLLGFEIVK